jgi:hypothetical protein
VHIFGKNVSITILSNRFSTQKPNFNRHSRIRRLLYPPNTPNNKTRTIRNKYLLLESFTGGETINNENINEEKITETIDCKTGKWHISSSDNGWHSATTSNFHASY